MSFGVYIHIPFCRTKCNYCHFVIRPWKRASAERYHKALLQELDAFFARCWWTDEADSIYFGGGTPSLVPVEHIAEILAACRRRFPVSADCEISLESNPGTLTADKAAAYREMGINRVSIGAQSFDDLELVTIGRDHTGNQVDESVAQLRESGIRDVNIDIMLGLPGQTEEHWRRNLERTSALAPDHISVYMLDLDERSPLYHHIAKGRCTVPDDDLISNLYLRTLRHFADCGYEQYEISNFAFPGHHCRHNLKYWLREPVLGFGVGSHSYDGQFRYANYSSMNAYLQAVESGKSPVEWRERVESSQALEETLFLGLRLNRGVDWQGLRQNYDLRELEAYESSLREMSASGLLEWKDCVIRLTTRGMLLSNEVFQRFV
jgi:oxygen-independent coproporphyrinogen-3 oxidase